MRRQTIQRSFLFGLLLVPFVPLYGCGDKSAEADSSKVSSQAAMTEQIKAIDANTHMPPEAKAAARAALMSHQNRGPGKP